MVHPRREDARTLRRQGLSFNAIQRELGISKSTLSYMLRDIELLPEQRARLAAAPHINKRGRLLKTRPHESKYASTAKDPKLDNNQKGRVAEAAIAFRLAIHKIQAFFPASGSSPFDCVAYVNATFYKLQIRWARNSQSTGLPYVRLTRSAGRNKTRRYSDADFDFLIGYDLTSDTAYVWSCADLRSKNWCVSVSSDTAERWDKLLVPQQDK